MFIKSVEWIDKDSQEAEIIVSDGEFDILCFSHPFTKNINDKLSEPIFCFDATDIMITDESQLLANRDGNSYRYFVRGKLFDKSKKIVKLGELTLCIEDSYVPTDILENSFIEFSVSRFNLY